MWNVQAVTMAVLLIISASPAFAEGNAIKGNAIKLPLNDASQVAPRNVTVKAARYGGSEALEVRLAGQWRGPDMDTFAFVPGLDFHDGTIEADIAGSVLPTALTGARGFIGVAFRIDEAGGSFSSEGFYIRPANGRSEDQVRRNHSTQYFSTQATISTACVAKRRVSTNLTPTLCLTSGLIYGSRYRARPPNSTSALPHSPCSLFTI